MPSMDVVSAVDLQALDNAINNVKRDITSRYDFRNIKSEISLNRKEKTIHLQSGDDVKVKAMTEMLIGHVVRFGLDPKCLDFGKMEATAQGGAEMDVKIKEGIQKETAQKMVKFIKTFKLKVEPAIQEDQLRITGKQIDDLQEVMRQLKAQDYDIPLQFVNLKR
ncbi:YajQ family cyclic di-GMP-binding protein [Dehalogenimonas etheniformans]|uniref:Nucleotide-binding protein JP09_006565 n=1 Tax=Dehalogenimonas etheniformans TaxID=1536648 RepID=A0A2P5P6N2_9CHLR|nr:YajQ family cyclic di-GMP-binding protein [Dehalogenimonas etheniformans]PPD57953.1 YajQ family cyclic di-GMP-binding protein [Dehalogenimonas etheniformans]QNT75303.1 YajQ family cyclic di-GMP-binding protein [Dehalogenimonas etheniformans]